VFDIFGIRTKIPFFRKSTVGKVILTSFIIFMIFVCTGSLLDKLHSQAYTEAKAQQKALDEANALLEEQEKEAQETAEMAAHVTIEQAAQEAAEQAPQPQETFSETPQVASDIPQQVQSPTIEPSPESDSAVTETPHNNTSFWGTQQTHSASSPIATISGLDAGTIKVNLKKSFGLSFSGLSEDSSTTAEKTYFDFGETTVLSNGEVSILDCAIYELSSGKIFLLEYTMSGDLSYAKEYLGYCASVPYDNSSPSEAKKWVADNCMKISSGETLKQQFGDVNLELYRSKGVEMISLSIYNAGYTNKY
jgi:hypothetical protein